MDGSIEAYYPLLQEARVDIICRGAQVRRDVLAELGGLSTRTGRSGRERDKTLEGQLQVCQPPATDSCTRGVGAYQSQLWGVDENERDEDDDDPADADAAARRIRRTMGRMVVIGGSSRRAGMVGAL